MDKKLFITYKRGMEEFPFTSEKKNQMKDLNKEQLIEFIEVLMENNTLLRRYIDILERSNRMEN